MATITENDEDELVPVETPLEGDEQDAAAETSEDGEDERLAESEDESEEDISSSSNRDRRRKRREAQQRAKDNAQRELADLRQTVAMLSQRVAQTETQTVTASVASAGANVDQRLAKALYDVEQAERIIAAATEAGNGQDVVAAMRIRDEARDEAQQLRGAQTQLENMRQQAAQPRVDPAVTALAEEWMGANPWYKPNGADRDSAMTKAIDSELVREGFSPTTRRYWEELTDRVAAAFGEADGGGASSPRRRAPPTGNSREHAPVSTRREIYVTPDRKQAMIDAGVWEDPVARNRYLKSYQDYDRENSAR